MQDALKQASTGATNITTPQSLTSSTPILTGLLINSTELPGLLQKAIVQSGLFYESHQAQWAAGVRPLTLLLAEPQAQLPPPSAPSAHVDDGVVPGTGADPDEGGQGRPRSDGRRRIREGLRGRLRGRRGEARF